MDSDKVELTDSEGTVEPGAGVGDGETMVRDVGENVITSSSYKLNQFWGPNVQHGDGS